MYSSDYTKKEDIKHLSKNENIATSMHRKSSYHFCGSLRKAEVFTPRLVLFSPPPVLLHIPPPALLAISLA